MLVSPRVHSGYQEIPDSDRVAKKAGLSKGSVYRAFASKEELLLAILEHFEEDVDKIMLESAQFELSPLSKIKLTMEKIGIYLKDNKHLLRVWNEFMYLDFSRGQYGKMMEKIELW
ncbi:TetR/AcrR family transcriptional regulator [Vibrio coralliilyticus]|uniref:TetR/AcrR family transcriptional regulator n=1 Tax=Vibrio coralliilyticus TaxID=190893 RepID=UPI00130E2AA5|nr:TetR/AcrR family transcriptional regulator [Vibrio coralliilyticus]